MAAYRSGSGGTVLTFRYTVMEGDRDTDGVSVPAGNILVNGGTLRDAAGNNAWRAYDALAPRPDAQGRRDRSRGGAHRPRLRGPRAARHGRRRHRATPTARGDAIDVEARFTRPVRVTGTPSLTLRGGDEGPDGELRLGLGQCGADLPLHADRDA